MKRSPDFAAPPAPRMAPHGRLGGLLEALIPRPRVSDEYQYDPSEIPGIPDMIGWIPGSAFHPGEGTLTVSDPRAGQHTLHRIIRDDWISLRFKEPTKIGPTGKEDIIHFVADLKTLDDGRTAVIFDIRNRLPGIRYRGPRLPMAGLYEATFAYFAHQTGRRPDEIHTTWESWSDNWKQYQRALSTGMPPEQAVFESWTGQRATENGYGHVIEVSPGRDNVYVRLGSDAQNPATVPDNQPYSPAV